MLSTRRAATVVSFLVSQGVNSNVIPAKGFDNTGRAYLNQSTVTTALAA